MSSRPTRRKVAELTRRYVRDGRAPIPARSATSRVMSANRARNTGPELRLRSALREIGVRGYALHLRGLPGRPDLAFRGRRLAVFVNGCFWHRCPYCGPSTPKSNVKFWQAKFDANRDRDRRKLAELHLEGWKTLTLWECRIRADPVGAAERIARRLSRIS